jgi:hypothetical protein
LLLVGVLSELAPAGVLFDSSALFWTKAVISTYKEKHKRTVVCCLVFCGGHDALNVFG